MQYRSLLHQRQMLPQAGLLQPLAHPDRDGIHYHQPRGRQRHELLYAGHREAPGIGLPLPGIAQAESLHHRLEQAVAAEHPHMALIDELHHQQGRQRHRQGLFHLLEIPIQICQQHVRLGRFVHQRSYGQGRLMKPLPQIGLRIIECDGLHGGDAGQGRRQWRRQRGYEDAIGFQLGQQLAIGLSPQAYIHHLGRQQRLADPGAVGADIPYRQRGHPQRQQGFGYGPVDGGNPWYLCVLTRPSSIGGGTLARRTGLQSQWSQQAEQPAGPFQ